jgi:hypothetical protein
MKLLKNQIIIQPPPFSNEKGQISYPDPIILEDIFPVYIDNTFDKFVRAQIYKLPVFLTLWQGEEYEKLGDWTTAQAEAKILEILGDNPASVIRSLYPKTLEENPNHPGTILSKMIKSIGIQMSDSCSCKYHALEMNDRGNDWCESNINTIVGWLRNEAKSRNIPFIDAIGKLLVGRAIKKSRKLLANEPVPENDEELDSLV